MFGSLGAPELLIIGAVIILIFGVGRISGLGKELGSSIKEFRKAVKDEDAEKAKAAQQPPAQPPQQQYSQPQYTQAQAPQAAPPPPPPPAHAQQGENKPPQVF